MTANFLFNYYGPERVLICTSLFLFLNEYTSLFVWTVLIIAHCSTREEKMDYAEKCLTGPVVLDGQGYAEVSRIADQR
jgi:hypothetical protein